jgi:hypothetical protein
VAENSVNVDLSQANEANRGEAGSALRKTGRYIKRIRYGNKNTLLDISGKRPISLTGDARDREQSTFRLFSGIFQQSKN